MRLSILLAGALISPIAFASPCAVSDDEFNNLSYIEAAIPAVDDGAEFSAPSSAATPKADDTSSIPDSTEAPEPGTWLLLGCGLVILGLLGRRSMRR